MEPHSSPPSSPALPAAAAADLSNHIDTRTAATEVAHSLYDALRGPADLVVFFGSFHHRAGFAEAGAILQQSLHPSVILGMTSESVLANDVELEGRAGLSAWAIRVPGMTLRPFQFEPGVSEVNWDRPESVCAQLELHGSARGIMILADPFSVPMHQVLPAVSGAVGTTPVFGGLASGASQPGQNVLVLNDRCSNAGFVGVTIGGSVDIDVVVSQGCRPLGRPMVITKARQNVIEELGGRNALEVVRDQVERFSEQDRHLLSGGMLFGIVANEYKERFGRGDFLVRHVLAVNEKAGSIAIGDLVRVGQTIQIHARDAETATEDLQLLLDAQQLVDPPLGGLLLTCTGRGSRLFGRPNHDVEIIRSRLNQLPLAGCFAAGEIGPVADRVSVHGHTAALAVIRKQS